MLPISHYIVKHRVITEPTDYGTLAYIFRCRYATNNIIRLKKRQKKRVIYIIKTPSIPTKIHLNLFRY